MKVSAYALLLAVLVVALAPSLSGQKSALPQGATAPLVPNTDAPDSCVHVFTVGSGDNSILYCVTDFGAITTIETPIGHPMIGAYTEGYGLCQESPAVEYHDYSANWTNNWNWPQIVSLTKSTIKISRTTSDGNWTLVQTISKVAATASIKVVMALTNNQSVDKVAYLLRFADIDPDGLSVTGYAGGASLQSAWIWNNTENSWHYGLQLSNSGKSPFSYQQGFVYDVNSNTGPNACDFAYGAAPSGVAFANPGTNLTMGHAYVGVVHALQTVTVTMTYRGT